jgi:hypothetical protein
VFPVAQSRRGSSVVFFKLETSDPILLPSPVFEQSCENYLTLIELLFIVFCQLFMVFTAWHVDQLSPPQRPYSEKAFFCLAHFLFLLFSTSNYIKVEYGF